MGSCYSKKSPSSGLSIESKAPKQKRRKSKLSDKQRIEDLPPEKVPLKNVNDHEKSLVDAQDTVQSHQAPKNSDLKTSGHCVALSDSGIESIQTLQEDIQDSVQSSLDRDELIKRLEHLGCDHCQKCGHLKINVKIATMLASNHIHDSELKEKSVINPPYQVFCTKDERISTDTDGVLCDREYSFRNKNLGIFSLSESNNAKVGSDANSEQSSHLIKSDFINEDQIHGVSGPSGNSTVISTIQENNSIIYELFHNENCRTVPNVANSDSTNTHQDCSQSERICRQQSLLNSILKHIDSICKCDFHSNEYGLMRDHIMNSTVFKENQHARLPNCIDDHLNSNNNSGSKISSDENGIPNSLHNESTSEFMTCSGQKNCSSLKNIATDDKITVESSLSLSTVKPSPALLETYATHLKLNVSGIHTHKTNSEPYLIQKQKAADKWASSFVSAEALTCDMSMAAQECDSVDDMISLDQSSINRLTCQSVSSMRNLVESTDDLLSPPQCGTYINADGVECMVIPTEMYQQMQTELADLKDQLLCLSSLIQETEDDDEQIQNCVANTFQSCES